MIQTLKDFIKEYKKLQKMGWIKTHRSGNTGIGKTLEDLLGIPENNSQSPDFGTYELKAARLNANSMLTLFTKSPLPKGANTQLRINYGYKSTNYSNDEKVLHSTLNAKSFTNIADTGNQLKIKYIKSKCCSDKIEIFSQNGTCNAYWLVDELKEHFNDKYPNKLVYVKAESKGAGKNEEFLFKEAYVCNSFNFDKFIELLKEGNIYVDLRIGQYADGRTHDHGTGFRIKECDQDKLFTKKQIC